MLFEYKYRIMEDSYSLIRHEDTPTEIGEEYTNDILRELVMSGMNIALTITEILIIILLFLGMYKWITYEKVDEKQKKRGKKMFFWSLFLLPIILFLHILLNFTISPCCVEEVPF